MLINICTSCTGWRGDGNEFVYRGLQAQIRVLQKVGRGVAGGLRAKNSIVLNRNRSHNSNGVGVRWREVEVKGGVGLRATRRGALTRGCTGADADAGLVLVVLLLLLVVRRSSCSTGAGVGSQCLYYSLTSAGCGGEEDESQQQDSGPADETDERRAEETRTPAARRGRVRYWCFETKVKRLSRILAGAFAVSDSAECIMPHPMQ
jgi:hypothetical protein